MKHPAMKLIAELRAQASGVGLQIARLPDGRRSPALATAEQELTECIEKLRALRAALAQEPERCDDDDDAA